jgi:cell pole-organizing protein PopZ
MGSASLKVNEPSMEEILASIRRIIADDEEPQQFSEAEAQNSSPLKNVLDIAELHVSPLLGSTPNEPVLGPWSRGDAAFLDALSEHGSGEAAPALREPEDFGPEPIIVPESVLKNAAPAQTAEALLSSEAVASVTGAFSRLSESVRPAQPQTVEDLMKEMLRPMLKAWLDDNLPPLVERLVREEIERVARRRA